MEQIFENRDLDTSVRTVKYREEVFFNARDVAVALGYKNPRKSIRDHVWNRNKVILSGFKGVPKSEPPLKSSQNSQPNTIYLKEPGLYQMVFKSNLPSARDFQQWVCEEVLPSIRKVGSYTTPQQKPLEGMQIRLLNETDLHYKVIEYIRLYHPDALIVAGLGEYQDSGARRKDAFYKGYTGGQPDIIITNPMNGFSGFALELKTPKGNGVKKDNQKLWLHKMDKLGFKTLFSNDYTEVVLEIHKYFQENPHKECKNKIKQLKRKCTTLEHKARYVHRPVFSNGKY